MKFEVIDTTTGRPPSEKVIDRIAKEYGLMRHDIDQFAVTEDGHLVLIDDCGNCSYLNAERFNLKVWWTDGNNT